MSFLGKIISLGKRPQTAASSEQYILIEDRKLSGVSGGTFTSGAWRQRDLTTVVQDETGQALVSDNAAYLPAGSYRVHATVPALQVAGHQARLVDEETGHALLTGTTGWNAQLNIDSISFISGKFELPTSRSIRIEHYSGGTKSDNGFGQAATLAVTCETYTRLELFRTATS